MEPFIGQIMMFGGNFAPRGWANCDGQLLQIVDHTALFSILGTTYGGDGRKTFGLPDLRGRSPIHVGVGPGLSDRKLGQRGGLETTTLTVAEMPKHRHLMRCGNKQGDKGTPIGNFIAGDRTGADNLFVDSLSRSDGDMNAEAITETGNGAAHNNMQPFLCINYVIALTGIFPSRN